MIFSSSPLYTFVDRHGMPVCIMVWQVLDGFEVCVVSEGSVNLPAGPTALAGCMLADSIVQAMGLQLVREAVVPVEKGGVDLYWEIE